MDVIYQELGRCLIIMAGMEIEYLVLSGCSAAVGS